ncbi:MAG TPA: hypothetical protein VMT67_16685 [Terriglobales bacterium]|nr:hypothetical protein [Terriglobales bacterium]
MNTRILAAPRLAALAVLLVCVPFACAQPAGPATIHGLAVAGAERPSAVPEGFLITPFGYFHPSCVHSIADGDRLLADGRVAYANNTIDRVAPACAFAHYTASGAVIAANQRMPIEPSPLAVNGWLEYVSIVSDSSYSEIAATWTVPPEPTTSNIGEAVFFFPGFQDTVANLTIVQPVLQWYQPGPWKMASWNCCIEGSVWHSVPKKVSVGDTLYGFVVADCTKKTPDCGLWKIATQDLTTGKKSVLRKSPGDGQVWDWAFGAVLEAYGIRQCSDLPATTNTSFAVQLWDQNHNLISTPAWVPSYADPGTDPSCNYGIDITSTQQTLWY